MKAPAFSDGFTLLELMVTMAIVGIAAAIAVPSLSNMINNSRAERVTELFELDLKFSRSHAISRADIVRISPRNGDIANGWQIVAEGSGDILRQRGALDEGVTIISANGLNSVAFTATGQIEATDTITVRTSGCTGNEDKQFSLMISGQIAITELACIQ